MAGYLEVTIGPMFSGKTTNLIDKANRYVAVRKQRGENVSVVIINHTSDERISKSGDALTPHSNARITHTDNISFIKTKYLQDVSLDIIEKADYIAIDEGQFFMDLYAGVATWLRMGKHVHCSGLIADSNRFPFGFITTIMAIADDIEHLKAFCSICGDKVLNAPFTKCSKEKSGQVLVGGSEEYYPVCGKHF